MFYKKYFLFLFAFLLLAPVSTFAAKKSPKATVKDSEYDNLGETCKADGKCTFTRKEILPGNIKAEAEIVSLGAFKGDVDKIFDYVFDEVRRVATILNEDDPNSEVAKANANAGIGYVDIGPEFNLLLTAAHKSFLWSNGAFDISVTPEIGNFKNIKIKNNRIYLKKTGMKITLKNIVHGYIADLMIRGIYNSNISDALVVVGPTSRSLGQSVAGNWRTSVDDSEGRFAKRGMTLDTSNVAAGSSITGANAPTLDPRTGTPLQPLCRSVTIISRNAAASESLAYGVYVLGPELGIALINSLQTIRGVIVDNNGNFIKSPGL